MVLSRRTFNALAGTAALGLSVSGSGSDSACAAGRAPLAPTGPAPAPPTADGGKHTVGFDRYSMLIDGRRLVIWSGEFHPFRLPSPSLWRDVLQKMRAHGYNAVSIYVAWNYHSPHPGSTTSPGSATSTCSCAPPPRPACTSSCAPARTSTPRSTPAASPAG